MRIAPALLCALLCLPVCAQRRTPVIIDTDIGDAIDDALALALAVNSPELDIRGVTTVVDDVESKTRLAVKELNILGRRDLPVAMDALDPQPDPALPTHPRVFEVLTPAAAMPPGRRAVDFLVDTLMQSQDRITLVPIGPLTNLALALKAEPRIKQKIERIVLMGGAFSTKKIEYNMKRDPAAAEIVFRSGIPITAVGLDVTEPCKLRPEDMDRLRLAESPTAHFLLQLIQLSR